MASKKKTAGRCPECDSTTVVAEGAPDFGFTDDNTPALTAAMRCEKCGKAWTEVYLFDHIEEV